MKKATAKKIKTKLYLRKTLRVLQAEISRGLKPEHSCPSILTTRALPCKNLSH